MADSTSLPLAIYNLVNILSANFFDVMFGQYAAVMVAVNLVLLLVTLAVLSLHCFGHHAGPAFIAGPRQGSGP